MKKFLSLIFIFLIVSQIYAQKVISNDSSAKAYRNSDAALKIISTPLHNLTGDIFISGSVKSYGTDAITSFDITYNIDGGAESDVYSITGISINTGETYEFTHNVPVNLLQDGTYVANVALSNVNGGADTNTSNDSLSKSIVVSSNSIQRIALLEQFTTEACSNCPGVLNLLEGYMDDNPNYVMMCHHAGYGTDFLTIPESQQHTEFYGGGSYAPAGMVDRYYFGDDPGPVFWDGSPYGPNAIDERTETPAFVEVNVNGVNMGGNLQVTVSGEFLADFPQEIGISIWIIEDNIPAENQAGASNWIHRYAVRDAISARLGDVIITPTGAGDFFKKDYTFNIDSEWESSELYLVAFVNKMSNYITDREIYNAIQVKLSNLTTMGTEHTVTFNVTESGIPASNAEIDVYGTTLYTDESGTAAIEMVNGSYQYHVNYEGLPELVETFSVSGQDRSVDINFVGLEQLSKADLSVYPNPSMGQFTVKTDGLYELIVMNTVGQVVYKSIINNTQNIDLSELSSGLYIISVQFNNKFGSQTIVIE
jgi:hypothetical protein